MNVVRKALQKRKDVISKKDRSTRHHSAHDSTFNSSYSLYRQSQANCSSLEKRLSSLEIPPSIVTTLLHTMNVEISPGKARTHFEHFTKKSSACSTECKFALDQLEMLIEYLKSLDLKVTFERYNRESITPLMHH